MLQQGGVAVLLTYATVQACEVAGKGSACLCRAPTLRADLEARVAAEWGSDAVMLQYQVCSEGPLGCRAHWKDIQ